MSQVWFGQLLGEGAMGWEMGVKDSTWHGAGMVGWWQEGRQPTA